MTLRHTRLLAIAFIVAFSVSLVSNAYSQATMQAGLFNTNFAGPITLTVRAKASGGNLTGSTGGLAFTVTMRYLSIYGITLTAPTGSFGVLLDNTITSGSYTYKVYSTVQLSSSASFMNGVEVDLFSVNISGGSGFGTFEIINNAVTSANFVDWFFEYNIVDVTNYSTPFYVAVASPVPLPVQLVTFDGARTDDHVSLNWKTQSELNSSGFFVERSTDNANWDKVDFIPGQGTTDLPHEYSYTDKLTPELSSRTALYYRLEQVDRDGKKSYSSVLLMTRLGSPPAAGETATLLEPYPNPFHGGANGNAMSTIPIRIDRDQTVTLYITDAAGKVVQWIYTDEALSAGAYNREFNASGLPSGVYFAVLQTSHGLVRRQIVYSK
jgi:hypothetical protein